MDPKLAKKTQDTLGKIIKKPPLTEKLLGKPPFRFLHDIMTSVIKTSGFMKGLFTDTEMNSENVKDRDSKVAFLQKAIDIVVLVTGKSLSVKPAKIVAGHEPEKTNEFLQALATAVNAKVDNEEYVNKVLGKGSSKSEEKKEDRERSREKSGDRRKRDEEKRDGEKSRDREKEKGKDRERSRDKDRDDRHKDREERHRDKDRDREKDREERHKDRDRDKEKDRDRKSGRRSEVVDKAGKQQELPSDEELAQIPTPDINSDDVFGSDSDANMPHNTPDMTVDTTYTVDPVHRNRGLTEEEIQALEADRQASSSRNRMRRPKAARPRREPIASSGGREEEKQKKKATTKSAEGAPTQGGRDLDGGGSVDGSEKKRKIGVKSRLSVRSKEEDDALLQELQSGATVERKVKDSPKQGKDGANLLKKRKDSLKGKTTGAPVDKKRRESVTGPKTSTPKNSPETTAEAKYKAKMSTKLDKKPKPKQGPDIKFKSLGEVSQTTEYARKGKTIEVAPVPIDKELEPELTSSTTGASESGEGSSRRKSGRHKKKKRKSDDRLIRRRESSFSMLVRTDGNDLQRRDESSEGKENETPSTELMNGEREHRDSTSARLQRPSSAKGSRRRQEDVPVQKQMDPTPTTMMGEDDLPPQVAASRKMNRPSSARPAPPRRKEDTISSEPAMRLGSGKPANLIMDDGENSDEDETFVVEEAAPPPPDLEQNALKADEDLDDEDHGGLVKKIMETKKEYESPQARKREIEKPTITDAQRRKQREQVQKEIDKLRSSIQTLTRSANPLGKIMDYVQEDLDSMQKELEKWKSENKEHAQALKQETAITERAIEPLKAQLTDVDQAIKDQLDLIGAVKSNIVRNDQKVEKMLRTIAKS